MYPLGVESQKSPYPVPTLVTLTHWYWPWRSSEQPCIIEHCCNTDFRVALDYRILSQTEGTVKQDTLEVNRGLVSPKKFLSPRAPFIVSSPIWNGIWLQHNSSVVRRYNVSTSLSDVQKCDKSPQIVSWLSSLARQQQNTQSWPARRPKGIRGKGHMMLVMMMMLIKRMELSIMLINSDPVDCTSNAIECIAEEANNKEVLPPSCPQDHSHHPRVSHRHIMLALG